MQITEDVVNQSIAMNNLEYRFKLLQAEYKRQEEAFKNMATTTLIFRINSYYLAEYEHLLKVMKDLKIIEGYFFSRESDDTYKVEVEYVKR